LLSRYKPDADQQRKFDDARKKLEDAWGRRGDDPKSACFAFNTMIAHPSKCRGDYGVYDAFFKELTLIVRDFKKLIEELAGEFEPIE
jgi:hypothetical protein